jgi:hypothetical protein
LVIIDNPWSSLVIFGQPWWSLVTLVIFGILRSSLVDPVIFGHRLAVFGHRRKWKYGAPLALFWEIQQILMGIFEEKPKTRSLHIESPHSFSWVH